MRRKDGKIDRRSKEYQEAVARMAKARGEMKKQRKAAASPKPAAAPKAAAATSEGRRADGRLDQRTAEGKAMAEKMAEMRAKRGKKKGFFNWLFGG
jgi:hypothetical protein